MSRICLSCSLSNHSARPRLVSLIIDWAHLQSLTFTLHKLTHLCHSEAGLKVARLHGCSSLHWSLSARLSWIWSLPKVARLHGCSSLHWSMSSCLPVYPWNSSLPVDTQVYKQLILFILLSELSSLSLFCWKPFLSYFNKFPFDLHLPVCLLWPVPWHIYTICFLF